MNNDLSVVNELKFIVNNIWIFFLQCFSFLLF